jgi:hypothetical protein
VVAPPDVVGQLSPWPGANPPGTPTCVVQTPTPTTSLEGSESTTLATVTSTSAAAGTTPPVQQADTVTILSVTEDKGQGTIRLTITAVSSHTSEPLPTLVATGTGVNPLGQSEMISLGNGNYILEVAIKHGLDTVTVTSSHGGQMTLTL